jgi:CRP/FNR family cyclic AMP-dependent transcriptional regulator
MVPAALLEMIVNDDVRTSDHAVCHVISQSFRGNLCEQLARRPGRKVSAGEFMYFVGGDSQSLFYVKRGLVKTSRVAPDGRELTVQIHGPGEVFGELCFCSGPRREQATVLESSEVVELPPHELFAALRRNPDTALELVSIMSERLSEAQTTLQSMAFDGVMIRLVRALLGMAERFGSTSADETLIAHRISQGEIAELIGSRREVVSGLLNQLRGLHLIDYPRRGEITVRRQALQAYLDSLIQVVDK